MKINRRAIRVFAVLTVAAAAGQLVQQDQGAPLAQASLSPVRPMTIQPLAATPAEPAPLPLQTAANPAPLPPSAVEPSAPIVVARPAVMPPAVPVIADAPAETAAAAPAPAATLPAAPVPEASALATPVPTAADLAPADLAAVEPAPDACAMRLNLTPLPDAMIGLALDAPCHPGLPVVLGHAGLAVTLVTTPEGTLAARIPALMAEAEVSLLFPGGETLSASIALPDAQTLHRFVVQWQADDAFQLHAFENGADYGQPGHLSAQTPGLPLPGLPSKGGFVTVLGDPSANLPLLAEVYTFPRDQSLPVEVIVEASVTPATCGRELLGETLTASAGQVMRADLTLAMPDCTGIGDILVLKNLVPDTKIAAAN